MPPTPTIDVLLNLVPDAPDTVLNSLTSNPSLASAKDIHGYSLLHAASSYGHIALLRALVQTYDASPNILDEDHETPLFAAEKVEVAQCLVEELHADLAAKNDDGLTAEDKIEAEGEFPLVAAYLRSVSSSSPSSNTTSSETRIPPPLPAGVKVNINTIVQDPSDTSADAEAEAPPPDPEFRRRIEELAARDDFQSEDGQRQLRELVTEAVAGLAIDQQGQSQNLGGRDAKRRVG